MNEVLEDALEEYSESDQCHNGPNHVAELYATKEVMPSLSVLEAVASKASQN